MNNLMIGNGQDFNGLQLTEVAGTLKLQNFHKTQNLIRITYEKLT